MAAVLGMSVNISLIGTPNPLNPPSSHTPHPLHGRLRQIDDIQLATLQLSTAAQQCSCTTIQTRHVDYKYYITKCKIGL